MKKLLIFLLIVPAFQVFAQGEKGVYGEPFEYSDLIDVDDLNQLMASTDSLSGTFSGTIETSCSVKGCWMTLQADGSTQRVTFKNYGFFVPTEGLNGKTAIFQGYCQKVETSVVELQHYAEDAGKSEEQISQIVDPKTEYKFVATGVIITD